MKKIELKSLLVLVIFVYISIFISFNYIKADDSWNTATLSPDTVWSKTITYNGQSYTLAWSDLPWEYYWWWNIPSIDDKGSDIPWTPEWNEETATYGKINNNLWWWGNDNESNHRWLDLNNITDRQWPCPDWWHVPSAWEWKEVIIAWCHLSSNECQESDFVNGSSDIIRISKSWLGHSFMEDFWFNGNYRYSSTVYDSNTMTNGYYYNWAWVLGFNDTSEVSVWMWSRSYTEKIRCMKNSVASTNPLTYTLTFDMDGGNGVSNQTVEEDWIRTRPSDIPTKDGYIFKDRYTSKDYTQIFDFSQNATENKTAYARREYCGDDYKVINNKCILKSAWVYYKNWYIKVTNWIDTKYVKDKNQWEISKAAWEMQQFLLVHEKLRAECDNIYYNNINDYYFCIGQKLSSWIVELNDRLWSHYNSIYEAWKTIINAVLDEIEESEKFTAKQMKFFKVMIEQDFYSYDKCVVEYYNEDEFNDCYDNYMLNYINDVFDVDPYFENIENAWDYINDYFWDYWTMMDHYYNILYAQFNWNYYFRWNNNGVNFTDLEFNDENDYDRISNIEVLAQEKWFNGWKMGDDTTWWVKWGIDNPCDASKWEYLPTPDDWLELMQMWWDVNGYEIGDDWFLKFSSDMLINPTLLIYYNSYDGADGLRVQSDDSLWASLDENNYLWQYYGWSVIRATYDQYLDGSAMPGTVGNDIAMPVRCFLDIEEPEEIPTYIVTFETNGWTAIADKEIEEWYKLNQSDFTTTREWFTFVGWYIDESLNTPYDFDSIVEDDITLYAKWNKNSSNQSNTSNWWWNTTQNDQNKCKNCDWECVNWKCVEKTESEQVHNSADEVVYDTAEFSPEFSDEMNQAYQYSYHYGITTMDTIEKAKMRWSLKRIEMAKMLSQYAINVLWIKPDTTRQNKFADVSENMDTEYDEWVTLAYQLWIMWINMPDNKFRPNDRVTRAEFGTALSRMLFGLGDGNPYYLSHLAKLKSEWIITNDEPNLEELRWYVMLMLMRSKM